ncbi:MAG: hypothetical protein ACK5JT_23180 [Hyphomicrobiaceae bacterium]
MSDVSKATTAGAKHPRMMLSAFGIVYIVFAVRFDMQSWPGK